MNSCTAQGREIGIRFLENDYGLDALPKTRKMYTINKYLHCHINNDDTGEQS